MLSVKQSGLDIGYRLPTMPWNSRPDRELEDVEDAREEISWVEYLI